MKIRRLGYALFLAIGMFALTANVSLAAGRGGNLPAPQEPELDALSIFIPIPFIPPCLQCHVTCLNAAAKFAECSDVNITPPEQAAECTAIAVTMMSACFMCRATVGECGV